MSVPARTLHGPKPKLPPRRRATERARGAARENSRSAARSGASRGRSTPAPRLRLGFGLFCSAVIGLMVLGLVAMNAFLAQSSFRVDDLSSRVDDLSQRYLELTREAAHLSAPDRIAAWARANGMRLPDEIHLLHVPPRDAAGPVGGPDDTRAPDLRSLALKQAGDGES